MNLVNKRYSVYLHMWWSGSIKLQKRLEAMLKG